MADLNIQKIDEAYLRVDCTNSIAYELRDNFTFQVPGFQFTPQYKAKRWDGKIRLFDVRKSTIYHGLFDDIVKFCMEHGYTYQVADGILPSTNFSMETAKDFSEKLMVNIGIKPRDYQLNAFHHAISQRRALLLSPTASGKSLIIYMIVRLLLLKGYRGLIIVPTVSLVEQLYKDFASYGWTNVDKNVHRIYQGAEKNTELPLTISTWQSIFKEPKWYFEQFDFVIGDECHLFTAKSLTSIMTSLVNAKYRIGTTGTLSGAKTHELALRGLFGPAEKVTTTEKLMKDNHIADIDIKCILISYPKELCKVMKGYTYQEEIKFLVSNKYRNGIIRNLAISQKGNTLVLYNYVEGHGQFLYDDIKNHVGEDRKVFFIHGGVNAENREEVREIVEGEEDAIIVASYGTFSTGVNIKNLHNVIFASPSKSRIRNLQSIGRSLRKSNGKSSAILYDIADDLVYQKHENYTMKHFMERVKIYSEEKFKFKIYKVEPKGTNP